MGTVWRARDELLDRDVAVKEVQISPALSPADRASAYERTLREAKIAARLNHRGMVTVYDVVESDGRPWIIMELVHARSLDQVLAQDGPLPPARAAAIGQQLVSALASAHAAGVLHRDVKPSNVLLTPDGRAVLTDFGIATFEGDAQLTQTGMVMGTPAFTAPERIRGEAASPASDLWSLGATLFAAVQGHGPYASRGGALTTMNAVINEETPAAPAAGPLRPVIAELMHHDPAARPDAARAAMLLASAAAAGPGAGTGRGAGSGRGAGAGSGAGAGTAAGGTTAGGTAAGGSAAGGSAAGGSAAANAATRQPPGFGAPGGWQTPVPPATRRPAAATAWEQGPAPSGAAGPAVNMYSAPVGEAPPVTRTAPYPPSGPAGYGTAGYGAAGYGAAGYGAVPPGYTGAPGAGGLGAGAGGPGTGAGGPGASGRGAGGPGAGTAPRYGRRVALIVGVALVIVAAGLVGGALIAHHRHELDAAAGTSGPTTSPTKPAVKSSRPQTSAPATAALPSGYIWYQQPSTETGTAAGFRLAVPQRWTASVSGLVTYFRGTAGGNFLEVDLSRQAFPSSVTEAHWLQGKTLSQGKFPGYQRYSLGPVQVDGSSGALWSFSWQEQGVGRVFVQDYLFRLSTSGGSQAYALYVSGPIADDQQDVQIANEAVQSFQPQN
jgi:eukaryotic-like serine/threonine-protein kinase